MNIKFEAAGTDKRKMTIWFEVETELDDFVTSLTTKGVRNWISNIDIDYTRLRAEISFKI